MTRRRLFASAGLLLLLVLAGAGRHAVAQTVSSLADGRTGRIEFESVTPGTPADYLRRLYSQPRLTVFGTLTMPANGANLPAVVIVHGSGGVTAGRELAWAERLNAWGMAAFVIDSFAPRGIVQTATDQTQLSSMAMAADALNALKLLATHPRIDRSRIAVMGFSKGGSVALYTALEPVRRAVIASELRFAAHVAFYPYCNVRYVASALDGSPVLHLHGDQDDWTPVQPCLDWMAWFRSKGVSVEDRIYKNAMHGFDSTRAHEYVDEAQQMSACHLELDVDSYKFRRLDKDETLDSPEKVHEYLQGCRDTGADIGADPAARAKSIEDVHAFFTRVLGPTN